MILIDVKFDLEIDFEVKFDLEIDLKLELMIENSGLRTLAARNRARENFGLVLFLQTILVDTHFRADDFRDYVLSFESNFVDLHFCAMFFGNTKFRVDGFWDYATLPWRNHNRRE